MKISLLFLAIFFGSSCTANKIYSESLNFRNETEIVDAIIEFVRPHENAIRQWIWGTYGVNYNNPYDSGDIQPYAEFITCELCVPILPLLRWALGVGIEKELIVNAITVACQILNLAPKPEVCLPTISAYATPIMYIVENKPDLSDDDFCGILNPGCKEISDDLKNWQIDINEEGKPEPVPPNYPPENAALTKIVHFTDVHLDLDYVSGTNTACGLPTCCREENGQPGSPGTTAGKYGHFSCELPEAALKAMLNHAATVHNDAKFVFLTGDYIHSLVWTYGEEENSRHISNVSSFLKQAFENTDAEIYPLTGNHEPGIVNMYPPENVWDEFPLRWMYSALLEPLQEYIPELEERERFLKYGFYTTISRHDPTLRIVALNTNICYTNNFWLPYESTDTSGQLQWFADTLDVAEKAQQKVFLIGHIVPGSDSCWPVWSNQFNRIVKRYAHLIKMQWYGHSHTQNYIITFDDESKPVSLAFTGGSTTPDGVNSAYNVYYADGERSEDSTWEIVQHETYILNLTYSNANPNEEQPKIEKIFDSKNTFGLQNLSPEQVHNFILKMACDSDLFKAYEKFKCNGEDAPRYRPCYLNDARCKADVLRELFKSNSADDSHKRRLEEYILSVDCSETDSTTEENGATTWPAFSTTEELIITEPTPVISSSSEIISSSRATSDGDTTTDNVPTSTEGGNSSVNALNVNYSLLILAFIALYQHLK